MSWGYTSDTADEGEVVLSFVGPVAIGWWIDVIVIEKRIVERRRKEGQERVYIGRMRMVLVGFAGLYPVQT